MPRTSDAAVRLICELDEDLDTTPFIEVANDLVTEKCSDSDYTAAKLELIERWLSAHFASIRDKRTASEKAGPVFEAYQYKVELILSSTMYGQMAMTIDSAGNLAALSKSTESGGRRQVGVTWLGTPEPGSEYAESKS